MFRCLGSKGWAKGCSKKVRLEVQAAGFSGLRVWGAGFKG